jgi:hypothetical protein
MKTSKHPKLTNGQPAISCFHLSPGVLDVRTTRAAERVNQEVHKLRRGLPDGELLAEYAAIARRTLWHDDFAQGLKLLVCDKFLFRVTAELPEQLEEANGNEPLDFWDYGYVADVLRELIQEFGTPKGDRANLQRALAWVEREGSGLREYSGE